MFTKTGMFSCLGGRQVTHKTAVIELSSSFLGSDTFLWLLLSFPFHQFIMLLRFNLLVQTYLSLNVAIHFAMLFY